MNATVLKMFVVASALLFSLTGIAQTQPSVPEPTQDPLAPYRLFRTQNMYMFLLLETRTGRVSQVQWGTEDESRFVEPLNRKALVEGGKPGRFTLQPTRNIYNFLLLDQETGSAWQVQWGKNPLIIPIE
jgi:hypothetical protein